MGDEKDTAPKGLGGFTKPKGSTKKKAPAKKAAPKPTGYRVAEGRALTAAGRIFGPGDEITADQVADIEALVKSGYVVKA